MVSGFTLIELLTVISIISVLAMLLSPALKQCREAAKGAQCLSNLKQISLGIRLYSNDYENRIVTMSQSSANWKNFFKPYVPKTSKVYLCPSTGNEIHPLDSWMDGNLDYAINGQHSRITDGVSGSYRYILDLSQVVNPARKLMLVDGIRYSFWWKENQGYAWDGRVSLRHSGNFNAAFYDGHVSVMQGGEISGNEEKYITVDE
ncbi:MAG: prepilin-type N-terminal cleavage/methylation domain-containing protein [Verrucomicrobiae bacterium]|nr:prepilin-type N-terminal cleavage/methylation domain-containing protein [Verrucomicrobiae bacterium]